MEGKKRIDKEHNVGTPTISKREKPCPNFKKCGGCQYLDMPYDKQLAKKQKEVFELLKPFCKVNPIVGMEDPFHYRNKVHAVFGLDKKKKIISGVYKE